MQYERGRTEEAAQPGAKVCATDGDVLIDNLLTAPGVSINTGLFKPGAHTYWHSHERDQVFLVASGKGIVVTRDGDARIVRAGDVLYTPPGEEHWHGAAPDSFVTYTSISLGVTSFGEEVAKVEHEGQW